MVENHNYGKLIKKSDFINIVKNIAKDYETTYIHNGLAYSPIGEERDIEDLKIGFPRPYTSARKIVFPPQEILYEYRKESNNDWTIYDPLRYEHIALIGVTACDLRGLQKLDLYFREYEDSYYWAKRNNLFVVGSTCLKPTESCYCSYFEGLSNKDLNYDLWVTDIGTWLLVEVGSEKGKKYVADYENATQEHHNIKEKIIKDVENAMGKVPDKTKIFRAFGKKFQDPMWKELKSRCFACGKCNSVCPTCHCFNVIDEISLDGNYGKRIRKWDSCHLWSFSLVAGNHNFRGDLESRVKYRIYDKFYYPQERYSTFQCVGCGRCYDVCSADIDLREVIWRMIE